MRKGGLVKAISGRGSNGPPYLPCRALEETAPPIQTSTQLLADVQSQAGHLTVSGSGDAVLWELIRSKIPVAMYRHQHCCVTIMTASLQPFSSVLWFQSKANCTILKTISIIFSPLSLQADSRIISAKTLVCNSAADGDRRNMGGNATRRLCAYRSSCPFLGHGQVRAGLQIVTWFTGQIAFSWCLGGPVDTSCCSGC